MIFLKFFLNIRKGMAYKASVASVLIYDCFLIFLFGSCDYIV
jgi:hypothetical protein